MFEWIPDELNFKLVGYLDLKSLKKLFLCNKYFYLTLRKQMQIIASNIIKRFFKKIEKPIKFETIEEEDEIKFTVKDWVKIYYYYYPKYLLKTQLALIIRKIGYFFGSKRTEDMKKICNKYSHLSSRYILVKCISYMSKEEIEAIGW
jgi:hypothetical protein